MTDTVYITRATECFEEEGFFAVIRVGPFEEGNTAQQFSFTLAEIVKMELAHRQEKKDE